MRLPPAGNEGHAEPQVQALQSCRMRLDEVRDERGVVAVEHAQACGRRRPVESGQLRGAQHDLDQCIALRRAGVAHLQRDA
ncbi:MAG: hypothetical protein R3E65_02750 [Steroidobacteraceae bacterium]